MTYLVYGADPESSRRHIHSTSLLSRIIRKRRLLMRKCVVFLSLVL